MRILRTLLAGLSVLLLPASVAAQEFPTKPIRLIVPFPAGGPNDTIARVIGQRMSELIKLPVLIDNRGGQGGVLGTDAVAKAAPDGYAIAISSAGALAISPGMEGSPTIRARILHRLHWWRPCRRCWWSRPTSQPTT